MSPELSWATRNRDFCRKLSVLFCFQKKEENLDSEITHYQIFNTTACMFYLVIMDAYLQKVWKTKVQFTNGSAPPVAVIKSRVIYPTDEAPLCIKIFHFPDFSDRLSRVMKSSPEERGNIRGTQPLNACLTGKMLKLVKLVWICPGGFNVNVFNERQLFTLVGGCTIKMTQITSFSTLWQLSQCSPMSGKYLFPLVFHL